MHQLTDNFFARTVFAEDQQCEVRIRHASHGVAELFDRDGFTNQTDLLRGLLSNLFLAVEQLLEMLCVLKCDCGMTSQFRQSDFVLSSEVAFTLVDHLELAERLAVGTSKWHAQQVPRVESELLIDICAISSFSDSSTRRISPV